MKKLTALVLLCACTSSCAARPSNQQPIAAPTAAPAAAAQVDAPAARAPVVLLDLHGNGTKTTEKFTTGSDDWHLGWNYDCTKFAGGTGNFIVGVDKSGGGFSGITGVNQLGGKDAGVEAYHQGGTFYLDINSECAWSVKVTG